MLKQSRLDDADGHKRYADLQSKVKESEAKAQELTKQLRHMERIQLGQGKALEKITNENDHPTQIKTLKDQLKVAKDKNRDLDERLRREERNSLILQEKTIAMEERTRELVQALRERNSKRPGG